MISPTMRIRVVDLLYPRFRVALFPRDLVPFHPAPTASLFTDCAEKVAMPDIQPSASDLIAPELSDFDDGPEEDGQDPATEALALVERINERMRKSAAPLTPLGV